MSALVSCQRFDVVLPVRADGVQHYVRRDGALGLQGPALCGQIPLVGARGVTKWRRTREPSRVVCQGCHAEACNTARPVRVDWS